MTIDTNQFWTLLTESKLVGLAQTQSLFSKFSADGSLEKHTQSLADWLVDQKAISTYQAKILIAGHSGPFQYGNYTVTERIETGFMKGHFVGRHSKTGYPVLLQFFPGNEQGDLKVWEAIETVAAKITSIHHPNLAATFESVVLSNRRFVVSQIPLGSTLEDKLPRKARLPWKKACRVMAQVANGIHELHQREVVHNAVSPRTIWVGKNGQAQLRLSPFADPLFEHSNGDEKAECKFDYLAPETYSADPKSDSLSDELSRDLYSVGCVLFRLVAGRTLFPESDLAKKKTQHQKQTPPDLAKYKIPKELDALIKRLLAKNPADRPKSASEVGNLLGLISGSAGEISSLKVNSSSARSAFLASLTEFLPSSGPKLGSAPAITIDDEPEVEVSPEVSEERRVKIEAAAQSAAKRKTNKWKVPATITAALLAMSAIVGVLALNASKAVVENPRVNTNEPVKGTDVENTDVEAPNGGMSPNGTDVDPAVSGARPTLVQQLIEDDDNSLWESPSQGSPLTFDFVPTASKLLLVMRPAEIDQSDEGVRVLKSFGPAMEARLEKLQADVGLDWENIERLTISFHSNESLEYEPYFIVEPNQAIESAIMMQNWNGPIARELENQTTVYDAADGTSAFLPIRDPDGTGAAETISKFAFGKKAQIEEVALSLGVTMLPSSLNKVSEWTDDRRHFSFLFLRNSLFNEEGQKLMGLENVALNRELNTMVPDNVRGGLISLHLDGGSYVELMLDKSVDIKAPELKSMMESEFRSHRDMLVDFVAKIPASAYWDSVRIRYGAMLADFYRNIRWDVEHGHVVANCWLPPMAAHNLIAASEHVISFSGGTSNTAAATPTGPQTFEELLASKRDLDIANPPDLNVLMANIQAEIVDDFPKLPFKFNIRLIGGDLEKEGITKNQRPSELVMNQKTVSEILTFIMTSANPSKDISGPADPNCKLIWVVADDPDIPGQKAVLITTRKAASEKAYELPKAFRTE